jgi:bacterioferritin (cytochrome b1)
MSPTPREQFDNDLALQHGALAVLRPGIALCLEVGDHATRDLLERIIVDEERHVDWIEAQQTRSPRSGTSSTWPSRSMPDGDVAPP